MRSLMLPAVLLVLLPICIVVLVNEHAGNLKTHSSFHKGVPTIHSSEINPRKCSWYCHHQTNYCKQHHVSFLKPYLNVIDPFYLGIIKFLALSGNYGLANVLFLVVLWPSLMLLLVVDCIRMIRKFKKQNV